MRRVVVTGMGMVTPFGRGVDVNWEKLSAGQSGIDKIKNFDASDLAVKIGGEIPLGTGPGEFDSETIMPAREQKRIDKFILYGICSATDAVADSGWVPETDEDHYRTGVVIGSGIGGLSTIGENALTLANRGPRRVSPFFIPASLINLISGHVSIKFGFKGPNHAVVTACSTGAHAIGDAGRMIALGDADVMVAGGAESTVTPIGLSGFIQIKAVTSAFNDEPTKGSRPWDKDRSGFVMGEGSGCVVLEEYEHAKKRGAKIYGELVGYGMSGDAHHITAPASDGNGAYRAMKMALGRSGLSPEDIGYINAHGTSTPLGDEIEVRAVKELYGSYATSGLSVSSTKSAIGHLLGAAGSVEAIYSILAMKNGILPPTLNLDNPSEGCEDMDLVAHKAKEKEVKAVQSNSFGFGGTNASLVFKKV